MKVLALLVALLAWNGSASAQAPEMPELYSPEALVEELTEAISGLDQKQRDAISEAQKDFIKDAEKMREELGNCATCHLKGRIFRLTSLRDSKIRPQLGQSQRAEFSTWLKAYQKRFKD